jgi:hypothetical protein
MTRRAKLKRARLMDALDKYENDLLRERVRDLETALGQRNELLQNVFKLSPTLSNIFGLLLALPAVKTELINQRIGIAYDSKVAIHRLRKHLVPWGIEVKSKRLIGYWLSDEDKDRAKDLLARAKASIPSDLAA